METIFLGKEKAREEDFTSSVHSCQFLERQIAYVNFRSCCIQKCTILKNEISLLLLPPLSLPSGKRCISIKMKTLHNIKQILMKYDRMPAVLPSKITYSELLLLELHVKANKMVPSA